MMVPSRTVSLRVLERNRKTRHAEDCGPSTTTKTFERAIRQYGRSQDQVFPTGDYFKGGTYGSDVNFPIPFEETENEN
ncbi:MAG: hypothetical protein KY453_01765, partial [Gemmatimonadetes bacterium]|nr:hypothetical protein [Gemmatimonadota bacterium]